MELKLESDRSKIPTGKCTTYTKYFQGKHQKSNYVTLAVAMTQV